MATAPREGRRAGGRRRPEAPATDPSLLEELRGQLDRVTFTSEETGYTVARILVEGRRDPVTVVGRIPSPTPGEILHLRGEWTTHPRYGDQFRVVSCRSAVPAGVRGIEKYLGSGLIRGIGPVMAKRIVARFGERTLDVIENDCARLAEVPGIGASRVEGIAAAWREQKEIRAVMIFLQDHGVSPTFAGRIYKAYGDDAIRIVRSNPWRLAFDISGIGFLSADRVAVSLGAAPDSPERLRAAVVHALRQAADEGHVCLPRSALPGMVRELLRMEEADPDPLLPSLEEEGLVVVEPALPAGAAASGEEADAAETEDAVYLPQFHLAETRAADRLRALVEAPRAIRPIRGDKALEWVQERLSITLADRQKEAILSAATHKVSVITGGPGTGKTTIIRALLRIFTPIGARILLTAPTGRAAKRLAEASGREASTIHRMLEYGGGGQGFRRDAGRPLDADMVIVDEASMIDVILFHHLLKAIPDGAALILAGDADQLPSVGAGSVLDDVIASGAVPVVRLNEIFRQARTSSIVVNAHRIIQGSLPALSARASDDFHFIPEEDPEHLPDRVVELVRDRIPRSFGLNPADIQVITPMNRGAAGTTALNTRLQDALNPNGFEIAHGGRRFRVGDRVMQIRNDYDRDVYNGDIGTITGIEPETRVTHVDMDGRDVAYDAADLDSLVLAYAISVHKSQGAEYPAVVMPVTTQHFVMLQRNLIYTGVTRGRKLVILVGTVKALAIAVKNARQVRRHGRLKRRLRMGE